jgi:hypothetical protein
MKLNEADGSSHPGPASQATWTTWNPFGYIPNAGNKVGNQYDPAKLDKDLERQMIDRAIDMMFATFPAIAKDKKIRMHQINMLIGKVATGEISDQISIHNFIKRLKLKGIKVETTMKDINKLIRETREITLSVVRGQLDND